MLRVCRSAIPASCITLADLIIQVAAKVVIMQEALRVIVAEDEALIRMDVVATLQEAGYEVVGEAGDGVRGFCLWRGLGDVDKRQVSATWWLTAVRRTRRPSGRHW